ncbi:SDR family oxidoreductase [Acinetobacter sp. HY1485]|uniref:SDR family oxidoreductase n=1 Tax=Acinetobacter sp. HY1485 TaxID=2970918 RepID=UPI0022B9D186|nr:SDR family oxidoreductase [Acinetobacter sp. HY1485]
MQNLDIHAQKQELPGNEKDMQPPAEFIRENYEGSNKLKDKVALITGGDSGIGRSVAMHFAKEGAKIAITYLKEELDDANDVKEWVENIGGTCKLYEADLRDADKCRQVVADVIKDFSKINILVNNAGTQAPNEDLTTLSDEQWLNVFNVNVHSMFYLSKAVLSQFTEGDSIINVASVNAYVAPKVLVDYSATKGAMISFTRGLSNQVASKGIRVNAVAPGPVWTPLQPATWGPFDAQRLEDFGSDTPQGRCAQPSELGPVFVFLASQDSSFITGQTIHPNGGTMVGG